MKSIITLFFCAFCLSLMAQSGQDEVLPTLTILVDSESADLRLCSSAKNSLARNISPEILIGQNGVYTLSISAKSGKPKTIEGMDTKTFVTAQFDLLLTNSINQQTIWSDQVEIKGTGSSQRTAEGNTAKKLGGHKGIHEALLNAITSDYQSFFAANCSNSLHFIKSAGTIKELERTQSFLRHFITGKCAGQADQLLNEVTTNLDRESCEKIIQELSIKVGSGYFNHALVVNQLLSISPKATCAEEAVELAKSIGAQKAIRSNEKQAVQSYIQIMVNQNQPNQMSDYRRLYWTRRGR